MPPPASGASAWEGGGRPRPRRQQGTEAGGGRQRPPRHRQRRVDQTAAFRGIGDQARQGAGEILGLRRLQAGVADHPANVRHRLRRRQKGAGEPQRLHRRHRAVALRRQHHVHRRKEGHGIVHRTDETEIGAGARQTGVADRAAHHHLDRAPGEGEFGPRPDRLGQPDQGLAIDPAVAEEHADPFHRAAQRRQRIGQADRMRRKAATVLAQQGDGAGVIPLAGEQHPVESPRQRRHPRIIQAGRGLRRLGVEKGGNRRRNEIRHPGQVVRHHQNPRRTAIRDQAPQAGGGAAQVEHRRQRLATDVPRRRGRRQSGGQAVEFVKRGAQIDQIDRPLFDQEAQHLALPRPAALTGAPERAIADEHRPRRHRIASSHGAARPQSRAHSAEVECAPEPLRPRRDFRIS